MKLKVLHDTFFKVSTTQASKLPDSDTHFVKKGETYEVEAHSPVLGNHTRVTLTKELANRKIWMVFNDHIEIVGNYPGNNPIDVEAPVTTKDRLFIPNFEAVYLSQPIIPNGNFTWAEATKNGIRIPPNPKIAENIISIARVMEQVRARLGDKPITITSWYRDALTNRRIGGASRSQHIVGNAVDFSVPNMTPTQVYRNLDEWWGSRGGLASGNGFTHIDNRGYKARWRY